MCIRDRVTVVPFAALIAEKEEQAISFTSDEALRSKSGATETKASVNGANLTVKVADDTLGGSATFKQSTYKTSEAYGVMLQSVDVDGNVTRTGAVKVEDEAWKLKADLAPGQKVKVMPKMWPLADINLDGEFQGEVMAYVGDVMVASSTEMIDFDDGMVELMVSASAAASSIEEDDTINLTYNYVTPEQVIQVDVDEPTMTSIPADNAETDYAAGAVQFIWSDAGEDGKGEYAGDTYKAVTVLSLPAASVAFTVNS